MIYGLGSFERNVKLHHCRLVGVRPRSIAAFEEIGVLRTLGWLFSFSTHMHGWSLQHFIALCIYIAHEWFYHTRLSRGLCLILDTSVFH